MEIARLTAIEELQITATACDLHQVHTAHEQLLVSAQCVEDLEISSLYSSASGDRYPHYQIQNTLEGDPSLIISPPRRVEKPGGILALESRYMLRLDGDGSGQIVEGRSIVDIVGPVDFHRLAREIILNGAHTELFVPGGLSRGRAPEKGELLMAVQRFSSDDSLANWAEHKLSRSEPHRVRMYLYLDPSERLELVSSALKQIQTMGA